MTKGAELKRYNTILQSKILLLKSHIFSLQKIYHGLT